MKIKLLCLSLCTFFFAFLFSTSVFAQGKAFTAEELAKFDGKGGNPAYYAYEGKVYDVTGSKLWKEGEHFGLHAGQDLTGKMGEAPHGTEVFAGFTVVGTFGSPAQAATQAPVATTIAQPNVPSQSTKPWFESRMRIAGISILGWSGILLGVVFVLNFATCFAMPWSKVALPWKGSRPGPDGLDAAPTHLNFASIHKHFVWATVLLGMLHGILGLMQLLGIYL